MSTSQVSGAANVERAPSESQQDCRISLATNTVRARSTAAKLSALMKVRRRENLICSETLLLVIFDVISKRIFMNLLFVFCVFANPVNLSIARARSSPPLSCPRPHVIATFDWHG